MSSEKLGIIDLGLVISTHSIFHTSHKHTFVQTAAQKWNTASLRRQIRLKLRV